jgi:hypothetical protein
MFFQRGFQDVIFPIATLQLYHADPTCIMFTSPPPIYIDSAWRGIVPPINSNSHPTTFASQSTVIRPHSRSSVPSCPTLRCQPPYRRASPANGSTLGVARGSEDGLALENSKRFHSNEQKDLPISELSRIEKGTVIENKGPKVALDKYVGIKS